MEPMFFNDWQTLARTLVVGVLGYVALVFLLRISGRRTLSKMNAFDLVVTVALGSTFATLLLNRNVTLAQGSLALALLIGLQFAVTWSSVRLGWVKRVITGEPALLFFRGHYLPDALRKARVTEDEVRAAVRARGLDSLADIEAVILETDGKFSVIQGQFDRPHSSLKGIRTPGPADPGLAGKGRQPRER